MKFERAEIADVVVCEPVVHGDDRGYFFESFRIDKLADFLGFKPEFVQDNESKSSRGVLRGLHFQLPPHAQSKLVRVIEGEVLDVAVDMRKGSPTFGQSVSLLLSAENKKQLFIPRGFAHGFIVLSEKAIFSYKVDNYYNQSSERGVAYNDPSINIDWHLMKDEFLMSTKDQRLPLLEDVTELFSSTVNYYD
ncbi:dTDP-4-dehydrorhamnose 3,5-epimerase [Neptuniibacter pectenicola]|jgi:dTDP-4-dehydrorhamnose 3,5-epimerase|uniref:dTDP-4-dehydrorhamnose 3,5-epimerase n=1 Tax=Neptuniibacter pectenicola TaxID=1806669 RepID=A0ABU9TM42_9GAMM|nr:dTDP-4-dehydrorhamnose 3,5-epimerase [Neptuniibacter pectenicola]KXJ55464.1 MAG: dTDP-4-dehydrorhamnose 3,5-epimerase [Neptuniibacter sp. Phe_28]